MVSVTKVDGGSSCAETPNSVSISGTFRVFSKLAFHEITNRIQEVIKAQARVYQCVATIEFLESEQLLQIPPTVNDPRIHEYVQQVGKEVVGDENTEIAQRVMGSEDFAYYLEKVPGTLLLLGTKNEKIGSVHPPHNPYFTMDEDVMPIGAAMHAAFANHYLLQSSADSMFH